MGRRPKVLIVDDEPGVVLGLVRVLYKDNDKYDVLLASTGEIAKQIMTEVPVSVLITDIGLPGMSGIDLLCWAAAEWPETQVAVMTALDVEQIRGKAYSLGCLRIVKKPFNLQKMRSLILSLIDKTGSLSGRLSGFSVADVVQMLCLSRQTTALHIVHDSDSGVVVIEDGQIIHAVWGGLEGEEAFYAALHAKDGLFQALEFPEGSPRTIAGDWQQLLIEGMRREDERVAGKEPAGGPAPVASPPPPPPSAAAAAKPAATGQQVEPDPHRAAILVGEGFAKLKGGQQGAARELWEQALLLDPDNTMIKLNLKKLEKMATV